MKAFAIGMVCALFARSATADTCAEKRAGFQSASEALRDCLASRPDCEDERALRSAAEGALAACEDAARRGSPEAPSRPPIAAEPEPKRASGTIEGLGSARTIALLFEGFEDEEREEALTAAREVLASFRLIDDGTVRAARAFLSEELTEESVVRLRQDLVAERMVVVYVRADDEARYLAMRVADDAGTTQRFAEATRSTLRNVVKDLVSVLLLEAADTSLAPTPTPEVPTPTATPSTAIVTAPSPEPPTRRPRSRLEGMAMDLGAYAGTKELERRDWAPLQSHAEVGVHAVAGPEKGPWRGTAALRYSFASGRIGGIVVRGTTMEAAIGVRGQVMFRNVQSWLGAGPVFVQLRNTARLPARSQTVTGTGFGFWVGGGASIRVSRRILVGISVGHSNSRVRVNEKWIAGGGLHAGVIAGFALAR